MPISEENPLIPAFFWPHNQNVNKELRQRIAMQLMRNKRQPKNIGEGLVAIGDAIGDRFTAQGLEQADLKEQSDARTSLEKYMAPPTPAQAQAAPLPQATAYAPAADRAPSALVQPAAMPPPPQASGAMLQTTEQPNDMLNPQMPQGLAGPAVSNPPNAAQAASLMSPTPLAQNTGMPPMGGAIRDQGDLNEMDVAANTDMSGPRSRAIAGIESGGAKDPYRTMGARTRTGDQAYGKYQIMGANIPSWTEAALGRSLTPQQFLADPGAQEATFQNRFGQYADKYGEEGAAKAWFAGERGMNNPAATDLHGRLNVQQYGQDYLKRLRGAQGPGQPPVVAAGEDTTTAPPMAMALSGAAPPTPATFNAAPPARPIQPMPQPQPQVAQARPYVTPEPGAVAPLQTLQPDDRERELMRAHALSTNQYEKAGLAGLLKIEGDKREARQKALEKEYEDKLHTSRELKLLRERQQADADERAAKQEEHRRKLARDPDERRKLAAEAAELEAKAKAGKVPTVKTINGVDYEYDPQKGWIVPPGTEGGTGPDLPEYQGKEVKSYMRGRRALYNMGSGEALHNWIDWYGSGLPVVGNLITSSKFQTQYNAADEFTNLVLRGETGAGALPSEVANTIRRFIPKPGSSPELVEQMRLGREAILDAIKSGSGKGRKAINDFDKKFAEEVALTTAKQAEALKEGKTSDLKSVVKDLPPVIIGSKAEKDALPRGRRYRLPGDAEDIVRVKKEHD